MSRFRNLFGLPAPPDRVANTVQDEEDLSNFRILSDYVTSVLQSWTSWGIRLLQSLMIWLGLGAYFKKRPKP